MRFTIRHWRLAVASVMGVVVPAGMAWGCVALVGFRVLGPNNVQPGGTITVEGTEFARGEPVDIRLDSPTGPVLATYPDPRPSTMTSKFTLEVPIPGDIRAGEHFLVATQEHYDMNVGIPARAAFYVNASPPVAPTPEERATALAEEEGTSLGTYLLVGLGVAAAGLLVAGVASVIASRKPPSGSGQPQEVRS